MCASIALVAWSGSARPLETSPQSTTAPVARDEVFPWWEGQSDDWAMAAEVDYYGTSFYPKHSAFVDRDVPWRAAVLAEFGRGKVLTLGSYVSAAYQSRPDEAVQRFYSARSWTGPGSSARSTWTHPVSRCARWERGSVRILFVFNHGVERHDVRSGCGCPARAAAGA